MSVCVCVSLCVRKRVCVRENYNDDTLSDGIVLEGDDTEPASGLASLSHSLSL